MKKKSPDYMMIRSCFVCLFVFSRKVIHSVKQKLWTGRAQGSLLTERLFWCEPCWDFRACFCAASMWFLIGPCWQRHLYEIHLLHRRRSIPHTDGPHSGPPSMWTPWPLTSWRCITVGPSPLITPSQGSAPARLIDDIYMHFGVGCKRTTFSFYQFLFFILFLEEQASCAIYISSSLRGRCASVCECVYFCI